VLAAKNGRCNVGVCAVRPSCHQGNRYSVSALYRVGRVKNIVFTSGAIEKITSAVAKPRVIFGVPTSENNVFALQTPAQ
jgi:hypothetical protein